ncbi:MAG TPA: phenylalanine--tRNA ligase subunit beta [Casimicrobiaceae bacterium]|nr:phenylalanine--tRNA ligase subunit beta [Casimicrobiaceae bacterium]
MKFSERWLRTLCNPPLTTAQLCDSLTMAGLEVEETAPAAPPFDNVVVARIDTVDRHPDADRLRVCKVDDGSGALLNVVCGAPNAAAGMTAPLAREGAQLPGGLAIKRARVRGVESHGMLCSAKELGLSDDASGLLVLDGDLKPGTNLREALALDDTLITLKLTPNRADCLSLLGIAREVHAVTGAPLAPLPPAAVREASPLERAVQIEDFDACPRFAARVIEGINPNAPTPAWMKERLERSGIRSISAVVDITNYVMLEVGQPLHAYDDRLLEGDIVVRFARPDEKLTLLNGQVLDLDRDLLMVCDERKPLGLAGIMGGEHSGIATDTTTVYLEGAFWAPAVIQGKMRRLGFVSDAGYRFERGVDFELGPVGVDRATALIQQICGGRAGPLVDVKGPLPARAPVRVRTQRVAKILGVDVSADEIATVLERLQLPYTRESEGFVVTPPSYRFDLAIEEDLIEEVARIRGYESIPSTPSAHVQRMLPAPEDRVGLGTLRQRLVRRDWQEVITFSFVSSELERAIDPSAAPIKVLNPIAAQLDVMRTTLMPGLIETLRTNLNRKATRVRVFETGRVFLHADTTHQPIRIGGLAFGDAWPEQWGAEARPVDFFDVKGDLEALAFPRDIETRAATHVWLHPGRSSDVVVDGRTVGWLGELHPRLVRAFELPRAAIAFELDAAALEQVGLPRGKPVSRQPIVRRDMAVIVDDALPTQAVIDALHAARPPFVDTIRPFDVYRGPPLSGGRKSLAILVLMQDTERTLTDAEIEEAMATLYGVLKDRFGAELRT